MKIVHWVNTEHSGLFYTTMDLAQGEEALGHKVSLRQPKSKKIIYGFEGDDFDVHGIHTQLHPHYYKDGKPKFLFQHGEIEYCTALMKPVEAVMELQTCSDAFICFNPQEARYWQSFGRTYTITKGVNVDEYKPEKRDKRLAGNPAILYAEHWRENPIRHPLALLIALETLTRELPEIKVHLVGIGNQFQKFWQTVIDHNHYRHFMGSMHDNSTRLMDYLLGADIVVSPVLPSYGRVSLEALACDKPVIAYEHNPHATYKCKYYDPDDMAAKILQCWQEKPTGMRKYAEENLSHIKMAQEAIAIYGKYL